MTRIICINQDKFGKLVGYGFWTFITCGLMLMLMFTVIESLDRSDVRIEEHYNQDRICYYTYIYDRNYCYWENDWDDEFLEAYVFWIILNSINFIALITKWYCTQQTFKFSWCKGDLEN